MIFFFNFADALKFKIVFLLKTASQTNRKIWKRRKIKKIEVMQIKNTASINLRKRRIGPKRKVRILESYDGS